MEEVESGTRLVERVSVRAPRILRRFVVRQARESHAETLEKMKALLEGQGADRHRQLSTAGSTTN